MRSGSSSGGTAYRRSPRTCKAARLVIRAFNPGHASSNSTTSGAASSTCSNVSSTSSRRCAWSTDVSRSSSGRPASSLTSSARAIVASTSAGSLTGASATKDVPSLKAACTSRATSRLRRVLPMPGGPTSVSRRTSLCSSALRTAARSCLRPISRVSGAGRPVGGRTGVRTCCCTVAPASGARYGSARARLMSAARSATPTSRLSTRRSASWREGRRSSASSF